MGAADIVPGVSGGTVALVLGIYERLIGAVRDGAGVLGTALKGDLSGAVDRFKKIDWLFLLPLLAGILTAVVALASLIQRQLEENAEPMAGLFFGLVLASIVVAWRLLLNQHAAHTGVILAVGLLLFWLLGYQSGPVTNPSLLAFFGAGAVAICAMILPGISGSFILLMLGMYSAVIGTIDDRAIDKAGVFAVGAVIGLALFSTVLSKALDTAHDWVMAALIGLMFGSLRVLWPWPNGVGIVSSHNDEVVSGTGLDWPNADTWLVPTALAIGAFVFVVAVSVFAERSVAAKPPEVSATIR